MKEGTHMFNNLYNTYPNQYTYSRLDNQLASMQGSQMNGMGSTGNNMQQMQSMQGFSGSNIISVTGIEGARAFNIAPNSSVLLLDGENPVMYLKTSDSIGMQKITAYSLSEVQENKPVLLKQEPQTEYVTKEAFDALCARVSALDEFKSSFDEPMV